MDGACLARKRAPTNQSLDPGFRRDDDVLSRFPFWFPLFDSRSLHFGDALVHPPPLRGPARDLAAATAHAAGTWHGPGMAVLDRAFAQAKNRGSQSRACAIANGRTRTQTTRP